MLRFFFTFVVTVANLIIFVFSIVAANDSPSSDSALFSIAKLALPWMFGLLSLVNIVIVWRWRSSLSRPFSDLMRALRACGWVLNILMTVIVVVAALVGGNFSALAIGAPWILSLAALQLTRAGWFEKPQAHAELSAMDVMDRAAYYMKHKVEIDRLCGVIKDALINKHGFQPTYVEKIFAHDGRWIAVAAHQSGQSAQSAAAAFFARFYYSPQANNPEIFARHIETDEALPPDYDYKNWRESFFGRTAVQHVISLTGTVLALAFFYGLLFDVFLPSQDWRDASLGVALALGLLFLARWLMMWKKGPVGTLLKASRKYTKWDALWVFPVASGLAWIIIYVGVGSIMTAAIGTPVQAEFSYRKMSGRPCLYIEDTSAFNLARKCLNPEDYRALSQSGRIVFEGYQSWFGVSVAGYVMPVR